MRFVSRLRNKIILPTSLIGLPGNTRKKTSISVALTVIGDARDLHPLSVTEIAALLKKR